MHLCYSASSPALPVSLSPISCLSPSLKQNETYQSVFSPRCRHKRKMQNFWPCKSLPKRNGHLDTSGISSGGHSVAYEDPDAHTHHRPLVMRHHNMEVRRSRRVSFSGCAHPLSSARLGDNNAADRMNMSQYLDEKHRWNCQTLPIDNAISIRMTKKVGRPYLSRLRSNDICPFNERIMRRSEAKNPSCSQEE